MIAFEKSAGAVVFRQDKGKNLFLLLRYAQGHWGFPKGHIEKGEDWTDALKREIGEETGIKDVEIIGDFCEKFTYFYRAKGKEREERKKAGRRTFILKKVTYCIAQVQTNAVEISHEHIGYQWLSYEEALEQITYKEEKKVFQKAHRQIIAHFS